MSGRPALCAVLALGAAGCGFDYKYHVSRPQPRFAADRGEESRFDVAVKEPGYRLLVEALNRQLYREVWYLMLIPFPSKVEESAPSALALWIGVDAYEDGMSLDPARTSIVTEDGRTWHPVGVLGASGRVSWNECRSRVGPLSGGNARVDERACYRLSFAAEIAPSQSFELRIEGLSRHDRPVPVPAIRFAQGKYTDSESVP